MGSSEQQVWWYRLSVVHVADECHGMPWEACRGSDIIVRHTQRRWQSGPAFLPDGVREDEAPCADDAPELRHAAFEPTEMRKAAVQDRTATSTTAACKIVQRGRTGKKERRESMTRGVRGLNDGPGLRNARYGSRSPRTFGNSPVSAFMNSTRSFRSCSFKPIFFTFALSCGLGCPPLSYHSTTSSSVFWLPSCM